MTHNPTPAIVTERVDDIPLLLIIPSPIHGHITRFLNEFLKNQRLSFFMSQNVPNGKMINFTPFRYFRLMTIILIRELAKVLC